MTATIKPPDKGPAERRGLRMSSMEILGFSDSTSTWSDSPTPPTSETTHRGRHETTVADLQPEEFGGRLIGGNVRWGLVTIFALLLLGLVGFGYWVYQRPLTQQQASLDALATDASELEDVIPVLEEVNAELLTSEPSTVSADLSTVETAARSLFDRSGEISGSQDVRAAASQASRSALDGVRLAIEARSYRAAVLPILEAPQLETDPALIELDEAARQFGSWQLSFDNVRTALPDDVLSSVTERLDIISGDLAAVLSSYVDALREDDKAGAEAVLADLAAHLDETRGSLETALGDVQTRVDVRLEEVGLAIDRILDR
jgi:hypothetical protein